LIVEREKIEEFKAKGVRMPGREPFVIGELSFEPPITLNGCVIVGPSFIGRYSYVGNFTQIDNHTTIGRYCSIASSCTIGAAKHPTDWLSTHPFQYHGPTEPDVMLREREFPHTEIGHDVWIGANAVVLAGVKIGSGAVVGAGAIVTRDVEPYSVVVGAPAKIKRWRFTDEIVRELLSLAWWDLPPEAIQTLAFDNIDACLERLRVLRKS